jgi:hypothetical protein
VALQHEGVGPAHGLAVAHVDLAVREVVGRGRHELDAELAGDVVGERGVRSPRDEDEALVAVGGEEPGHASSFVLAASFP